MGTVLVLIDRLEDHGLVTTAEGEATKERGWRRKRMVLITNEGKTAIA